MSNKLQKPKLHRGTDYLDWNEIKDYIKKKYKRDPDDWGKKFWPKYQDKNPFQCFWHTVCDDISNGGHFYLNLQEILAEHEEYEDWYLEVVQTIFDEFGKHADESGTLTFEANW